MTRALLVDSCLDCALVAFGEDESMYCDHPDAPDCEIESSGDDVWPLCPLRGGPLWIELSVKARGSGARRLDVTVALDGGGMAHETITTVECPACGGTGDADRNAQERVWNKCYLCDGDGRVPEAVGAAYARGE